ncbi:MAG: hypothetical protein R6U26_02010 [Candidatus Undinarchaeales archaeon]
MDREERQRQIIKTVIERFKQRDKFRTRELRRVLNELDANIKTYYYMLRKRNIIEDAGWGYWKITEEAIRDHKKGKFSSEEKYTKFRTETEKTTKKSDFELKGMSKYQFKKLCKIVIERFGPKYEPFNRDKLASFLKRKGEQNLLGRQDLLNVLKKNGIIKSTKQKGYYKVTRNAKILYKKGEFNE